MVGTKEEEVTARFGGGLLARLSAALRRPAVIRIGGLGVGLAALGAIGQCVSSPAAARVVPPASANVSASANERTGTFARTPSPVIEAAVASVLPKPGDASAPEPTRPLEGESALPVIDINAATEAELRQLPGIGQRRARAILDLRARLGGFRKVEDLSRVRGIGRAAIKRLRPRVSIGPVASASAPSRPP